MSAHGQTYHTDEFGVTRAISAEEARAYDRTDVPSSNVPVSKKSYIRELNPASAVAPDGFRLALQIIGKMLSSLSSPAVIWAILASSISLGRLHSPKRNPMFSRLTSLGVGISMSLTYGLILTQGYGWSHGSVGLVNVGFPISVDFLYANHFDV